jgi:hypothetical protein
MVLLLKSSSNYGVIICFVGPPSSGLILYLFGFEHKIIVSIINEYNFERIIKLKEVRLIMKKKFNSGS